MLKSMLSGGLGLTAAIAVDAAVSRLPRGRIGAHAAGLACAAAVYPLARSERNPSAPVTPEIVALLGFAALSALAAGEHGARLLAAGWVGHAVFDLVHDAGAHSRLPDWYPAACAGYDVGVAARLLSR